MQNFSEFLDDIKAPNVNVYRRFLCLSKIPECYSSEITYPPVFDHVRTPRQRFYAYVIGKEVLIVMVDQTNDEESELADEEEFHSEYPLWFTDSSHRVSPAYILNHAARAFPGDYKVTMMLLTSSYIINYDDWIDSTPYKFDFVVRFDYCISPELPYNMRPNLPEAHECLRYYEALIPILEVESNQETEEDEDIFDEDECVFEDDDDDSEIDDDEDFEIEDNDDDDEDDDEDDVEIKDDDIEKFFSRTFKVLHDDDDDDDDDDDQPGSTKSPYAVLGQAQREDRAPVRVLPLLKNAREELDRLVGMGDIRNMIEDLVALHTYNQRLYDHIKKKHQCSLHSIFSGAVGTGKTTMAQIMASLLHEAGVLSKGHCVVCNRASFIGRQWGTEEQRLIDVVERAAGGVLLVDEAYSLVSEHPHDPGRNVLNMMLDILADEKYRDIAVIFCGYTKEMEKLLSINPGLDSRFPNRFEFKDFSFDELMEISRRKLAVYGYQFTPNARRKYRESLRRLYDARPSNWANGREVANLLESIYKRHSVRCIKSNVYGADLLKIRSCDIPEVTVRANNSRRVGF